MTERTLQFYEKLLEKHVIADQSDKVYQVMEYLSEFDGVSSIVVNHAENMKDMCLPFNVICEEAPESLSHITLPMEHVVKNPDCCLIYHYWNYKTSTWVLHASRGSKALYYHNITPADFFVGNLYLQRTCQMGIRQLSQIANNFDLLVGDSQYNINELREFITETKPSIHIYPIVAEDTKNKTPYDHNLVKKIKKDNTINFIFVGRVAQNKKFEKIMAVFDYYFRHINSNSRLWLIGSDKWNIGYRQQLEKLRINMKSADNIIFTGLVQNEQLYAYYHIADVFLCGSEHEGFCIPLVEAMAYDIPVLAYAEGAIPETMGDGGVLIKDWDIPRIATLIHMITTDQKLRDEILETQRVNLKRFSKNEARKRMTAVVEFLQSGKHNDMFKQVTPKSA